MHASCRRLVLLAPLRAALPFVLFLFLFASCARREADVSEHVQLVLNPESLAPTTTFELRFDEPVVSPAHLGEPIRPSPLVIKPAIKGRFTWISESAACRIEAGCAYAEMTEGRHRFAARCERTGEQIETWVEVKGL